MQIESDVTDLARIKQEKDQLLKQLRENRARLQLIQQAANIGIFDWDIQTGVIVWTKEAEMLYGLVPGGFGGSFAAWERSVHPDDLARAREKVLGSVTEKINLDTQFRVIWPGDQSVHWIYAKARTFYDRQGKPLRMLGVNIDITERKRYEEELRIRDEKLRLFAESDVIGLVFTSIYGDISYANDAFLHLIGYSRSEFTAKNIRWTDITPEEWLLVDRQQIEEARESGKPALYEKQYIHHNGSRVDVFIGYHLFGEQRDQAATFVLDVTERKRLERQKDEFIGVVSHELRTPVTSLKVFAQLLQKRFQKSGDRQNAELLMKMSTQIDKLTRLIGDLVDVTKLETGKLQLHLTDFALMPLIDEIVEEMQRTTTQHTILKEGVITRPIRGDRDRIGQVLTNLLGNAIKYSPHASKILVKVSLSDEQVTVSVQDFGLGIVPEKQEQVFQRFYRVEEKGLETIPGMGLGLYISAEMVKRHGGDIGFESVPGYGSTFFFSIPFPKQEPASCREDEVTYEQKDCDRR